MDKSKASRTPIIDGKFVLVGLKVGKYSIHGTDYNFKTMTATQATQFLKLKTGYLEKVVAKKKTD